MASPAFGPQPTDATVASNQLIAEGYMVDPGLYNIDMPGQLDNVPAGSINTGGVYASDPSGIGAIYPNPTVNPNPTGGWQTTLATVAALGAGAFSAFERGSPAVATPAPRAPSTSVLGSIFAPSSTPGSGLGPFSWGTIAVIAIGAIVLVMVAEAA